MSKEYPKAVYHNRTGAAVVVASAAEIPDGYITLDEYNSSISVEAAVDAAAGALISNTELAASQKAADDAAAARAEAAKATEAAAAAKAAEAEAEKVEIEAERADIKAFLDSHKVEYAPQLGLTRLQELKAQLEAHLAAEATKTSEAGDSNVNGA